MRNGFEGCARSRLQYASLGCTLSSCCSPDMCSRLLCSIELMTCYQEEVSEVPVRSTYAGSRCCFARIKAGQDLAEQLQGSFALFFVVMSCTIRHAASALIFALRPFRVIG